MPPAQVAHHYSHAHRNQTDTKLIQTKLPVPVLVNTECDYMYMRESKERLISPGVTVNSVSSSVYVPVLFGRQIIHNIIHNII